MTKIDKGLFKTNKTEREIADFYCQMNFSSNDSVAFICRGNRMKTIECFLNEISAVLQFPYYFSGNFNSFSECIRDLAWIFKKRIFVFITNSDQILSEEPYNYLHFFERSTEEVPIDTMQYDNEEKHVYYIFQNIDQDFPVFEDKELSEFA